MVIYFSYNFASNDGEFSVALGVAFVFDFDVFVDFTAGFACDALRMAKKKSIEQLL